jgi:uncharacterized membrane protein
VTGRLLAWVGGAALLIGIAFLLSLAFSRGWIGPEARCAGGLAAGAVLMAGGAWAFGRRQPLFGHVLTAVGLGAVSLALYAATRLYGLVPPEIGLAATLLTAIAAGGIAVRADSQAVGAYGLVAVLAAPPVLGAPANIITIGYLATLLAGTTVIALARTWSWLPPLAFALSAPQLALWLLSDPPAPTALVLVAGFWVLYGLAAGGEEYRRPSDQLRSQTVSLVLADAAFTVASLLLILADDTPFSRGAALAALAGAHLAVGIGFLHRRGERHPFGLLVTGVGIAVLTLAVPVALDGPVVALGWTAEATVLAWVSGWRGHRAAGYGSVVLASLALAHLAAVELPVVDFLPRLRGELVAPAGVLPFMDDAGVALAGMLAGLVVSAVAIRAHAVRCALAALGLAVASYAVPYEIGGVAMPAVLAGIAVVAVAAAAWLASSGGRDEAAGSTRTPARFMLYMPAIVAGTLALCRLATVEMPARMLGYVALPAVPFTDVRTLAAGTAIGAAAACALLASRDVAARAAGVAVGSAVVAYLALFELPPAGVVVTWSALAALQAGIVRLDRRLEVPCLVSWGILAAAGLAATLVEVVPPDRLWVRADVSISHPPFVSEASAALASLIGALAAIWYTTRARPWSVYVPAVAGALGVYLLSVGAVDDFQSRVGGAVALEELQKQAQVTLSIMWAGLGVAMLVAGVRRDLPDVRRASLALLALATVKVFVVDLSALDVAYRVLSFIGLGLLLLGSAYLFQTLRARPGDQENAAAPR